MRCKQIFSYKRRNQEENQRKKPNQNHWSSFPACQNKLKKNMDTKIFSLLKAAVAKYSVSQPIFGTHFLSDIVC